MLPPKGLNLFDEQAFAAEAQPPYDIQDDGVTMNLQERVTELEARNLHLQTLVVELLNKNEQLRREITAQKAG